jgi:hypothetical protein
MDKYKYNKYKLKYTLLKQQRMIGGDGDSDDEDVSKEAAAGNTATREATVVKYPGEYGIGTITSTEYYKIIDDFLIKHHINYDPLYNRYENFDKIAMALPGEETSKLDYSVDYYDEDFKKTQEFVDNFGNICNRHKNVRHVNSDHKLYLYNYIKTYIENFRNWQIEHLELYISDTHPASCKYCNNTFFHDIVSEQNYNIEKLVASYDHECVKECRESVEHCGSCGRSYFGVAVSCSCDVVKLCPYHNLLEFDTKLN